MSLLLLHTAVTFALVGLIWTVQIVHYPLMDGVGRPGFVAYHRRHAQAITWVVAPLMLAEITVAAALAFAPPAGVPALLAWIGLALVGLLWAVTAFVSVPLHQRLEHAFEPRAHRRLVSTNWIRTAGWTARGVVALAMVVHHGTSLQLPPIIAHGA